MLMWKGPCPKLQATTLGVHPVQRCETGYAMIVFDAMNAVVAVGGQLLLQLVTPMLYSVRLKYLYFLVDIDLKRAAPGGMPRR